MGTRGMFKSLKAGRDTRELGKFIVETTWSIGVCTRKKGFIRKTSEKSGCGTRTCMVYGVVGWFGIPSMG